MLTETTPSRGTSEREDNPARGAGPYHRRAMRRLIDVLRQLAESPEVEPALASALARAARVIDRGIVLESALI